MSSEFKLNHSDGGVTLGIRICAANAEYWHLTIYPAKGKPRILPMADTELRKYLDEMGMSEEFIGRIIGRKQLELCGEKHG
jgi:hypothetical protein